MLSELQAGLSVDEIMKRMDSGMPKLWVIYKALHLRRSHPECFGESSAYTPLPAEGSKQAPFDRILPRRAGCRAGSPLEPPARQWIRFHNRRASIRTLDKYPFRRRGERRKKPSAKSVSTISSRAAGAG